MSVYLDNAATKPLSQKVKDAIINNLDLYHNPSSLYMNARIVKSLIQEVRFKVCQFINAPIKPESKIIFTSSASVSNNIAIIGFTKKFHNHLILCSPTAHKSMRLASEHCYCEILKVNQFGQIDLDDLQEKISASQDKHILIATDWGSSEIGTIQDIDSIIKIVATYRVKFNKDIRILLDCTQSISQFPLDLDKYPIDMVVFSGHKLGSLKGVGVLYLRNQYDIEPIMYGTQEDSFFPGTENTLGILSLGVVLNEWEYPPLTYTNIEYVYNKLKDEFDDIKLVGTPIGTTRLPNHLYLNIPNVAGTSLQNTCDTLEDIEFSTGSACNSGSQEPPYILKAINYNANEYLNCIRLTFSGYEQQDELDTVCQTLSNYIKQYK